MFEAHPTWAGAVPLYYAMLCSLCVVSVACAHCLVGCLTTSSLVIHSQDIDTSGRYSALTLSLLRSICYPHRPFFLIFSCPTWFTSSFGWAMYSLTEPVSLARTCSRSCHAPAPISHWVSGLIQLLSVTSPCPDTPEGHHLWKCAVHRAWDRVLAL